MNTDLIIEMIGYLGSALVLVSFLMTSVVKLRLVNSIGGFIFFVYALIIHSYPTAVMNFCLVLINIRFLLKTRQVKKVYEAVFVNPEDLFLKYLLDTHKDDILRCFPNISLDFSTMSMGYIICCEGEPVAITIGRHAGDDLELLLDYSMPKYRDFSVGEFLMQELKNKNIKKVLYYGPTENHESYLRKTGFQKCENHWQRIL